MSDTFRDDNLFIHYPGCRVWVDGNEVQLSALRFRILEYLTQNAGRPLSARQILNKVWQSNRFGIDVVKWHIAKLRHEIGDRPARRVVYVRGFGYRYDRIAPENIVPFPTQKDSRSRSRIRLVKVTDCKSHQASPTASFPYPSGNSISSCLPPYGAE